MVRNLPMVGVVYAFKGAVSFCYKIKQFCLFVCGSRYPLVLFEWG